MYPQLQLKVRASGRHPWFYRKMVKKPQASLKPGSPVWVKDRAGKKVGTGFYNPRTELALRMLAFEEIADVESCLLAYLQEAMHLRSKVLGLPKVTNAYRLVHSEGDGFPGLILDRLGDTVVAQVFSLCMMEHMEAIGQQLLQSIPNCKLVLTVDAEARKREGIPPVPPPQAQRVEVKEHGIRFGVHPGSDHKTGFFADQRDNRQLVRQYAKGRRVLDLCCNSGGFAMAAHLGGALSVQAVDLDEVMVQRTMANANLNGIKLQARHGDAFDELRQAKAGSSDLVILDPPKWARGRDQVDAGLERYYDLNRLAMEKLQAGGLLMTCSCSGAVTESRFLQTLAKAAAAAGKQVRILHIGGAGPDHPVALECPETRYLKSVLLSVR